MKKHLLDSLVIGFALFSMFFGAGNVIFPPYLGLESGPEWLLGFLSYFLADIGLAMLAMFAILRQGSPDGITARIGKLPSTVLMCAIVLCIGPMLAIPRTAATTYETSLAPLVAGFSPVLFSILFFLLILGLPGLHGFPGLIFGACRICFCFCIFRYSGLLRLHICIFKSSGVPRLHICIFRRPGVPRLHICIFRHSGVLRLPICIFRLPGVPRRFGIWLRLHRSFLGFHLDWFKFQLLRHL